MKKNGYTLIELIILISVLGLITIITLSSVSRAFSDNKQDLYETKLELYLTKAEYYGNQNKDKVKEEENYIITIKELVDEGYINTIDNDVIDDRDNSSMLSYKFKLTYDEESDYVSAELLS